MSCIRSFLPLVEVNTLDGPHRFMLGVDASFRDVNGLTWNGSTLLGGSENQMVIGNAAPEGSLAFTFIQDPSMDDVVAQMKALGAEYVRGLPVRFYRQRFADLEEVGTPVTPPRLMFTRTASGLIFAMDGVAQRQITLTYEGGTADGNHQGRRVFNTADHAKRIGSANPSFQFAPHAEANDVSLFG